MTEVDLTRIRGQSIVGRRDAFEKFVCQLARGELIGGEVEFRRVEGSGGDGGVEAYWVHADGTKRAYQAKYWTRAGDINWRQIDNSVKEALEQHPEITSYTIALACDLTDRSGKKGQGKRGWEHWETHRKEWEKWAEAKSLAVQYRAWTAFELESEALQHLPRGALNYWFDGTLLDDDWFAAKAAAAIDELGTRYSPLKHIETEVQECFRAFARDPAAFQEISQLVACLWARHVAAEQFLKSTGFTDLASSLSTRFGALDRLSAQALPTDIAGTSRWSDFRTGWLEVLADWVAVHPELHSRARQEDPTGRAVSEIDRLTDAIVRLREALGKRPLRFSDARALLLLGTFGTGKSHAMGRILESAIEDSRPVILFLGQQFHESNPRTQMVQFADLPTLSTWTELLDALNAASEEKGMVGLVLIDAINEGAGLSVWPNQLKSILGEVATRPALRIVVSCRTEYRRYAWPDDLEVAEYELTGFTEDEFRRACVRLMDDEGVARPTTAFIPPELYNPLILSTACQSLVDQGLSQFPGSLAGLSGFVDLYVHGIASNVVQRYNIDGSLEPGIQGALLALAEALLDGQTGLIAEPQARQVVQGAIGRVPPPRTEWLNVLERVGVLRLDPSPQGQPWNRDGQVVSFSFQIHEQEFVARALMKRCESSKRPFDVGEPLHFVRRDIDEGPATSPSPTRDWHGVLMAMSVLWAGARGQELVDVIPLPSRSPRLHILARSATLEGFLWRKPAQVTARTTQLLSELGGSHRVYSTMLKFAGVVGHPWNAFSLDERLLAFGDMARRDAEWTVGMNDSTELQAAIEDHIRWTLEQNPSLADATVSELATLTLAWTLTSTNRRLRDRATKALVYLFRAQPDVIPSVLQRFAGADDAYLLERVLAAVYGACCTLTSPHVELAAQAVFRHVFADGAPAHLLVRDSALGVIERASFLGVLPKEVDIEACIPPHSSDWPLQMRTNAEIDALASSVGDEFLEIARSCTTEYGRGVGEYGDFGRYVLESRVDWFSTLSLSVDRPKTIPVDARWDGELIGNWVAHRAYEMGWNAELFPHDRTKGQFSDRGHGKIERIGKKYQWIAMYELLGILSDHVWCVDYWDNPKRYHSALDLEFCRAVDPTVISQASLATSVDESLTAPYFRGLGDVHQADWPFTDEPLIDLCRVTTFISEDGRRWQRLYARVSEDSRGDDGSASFLSFASLSTVCVPVRKLAATLEGWEQRRKRVAQDLRPPDFTDHGYLFELGWRQTADGTEPGNSNARLAADRCAMSEGGFMATTYRYVWEHGLDESLMDGVSCCLPAVWVAEGIGLAMDVECPTSFRYEDGRLGFFGFDGAGGRGHAAALIDADAFDRLLVERELVCLWVLGGERLLAPAMGRGRRRFFSGVAWFEDGELKSRTWMDDTGS